MFISHMVLVSWFHYHLEEGFFAEDGLSKKMLSNEELLIILRQQINYEKDQKAAAIDQTTGCKQLVYHNQLLGHLW